MRTHDDCTHVSDAWSWRGEKFPYTAHITLVQGPRRGEEVVDDVHVELDHSKLPLSLANWLGKRCDKCRQTLENIPNLKPHSMADAARMAAEISEAEHCEHNEGDLCKEIAKTALDIYMLRGPDPK